MPGRQWEIIWSWRIKKNSDFDMCVLEVFLAKYCLKLLEWTNS